MDAWGDPKPFKKSIELIVDYLKDNDRYSYILGIIFFSVSGDKIIYIWVPDLESG